MTWNISAASIIYPEWGDFDMELKSTLFLKKIFYKAYWS